MKAMLSTVLLLGTISAQATDNNLLQQQQQQMIEMMKAERAAKTNRLMKLVDQFGVSETTSESDKNAISCIRNLEDAGLNYLDYLQPGIQKPEAVCKTMDQFYRLEQMYGVSQYRLLKMSERLLEHGYANMDATTSKIEVVLKDVKDEKIDEELKRIVKFGY